MLEAIACHALTTMHATSLASVVPWAILALAVAWYLAAFAKAASTSGDGLSKALLAAPLVAYVAGLTHGAFTGVSPLETAGLWAGIVVLVALAIGTAVFVLALLASILR